MEKRDVYVIETASLLWTGWPYIFFRPVDRVDPENGIKSKERAINFDHVTQSFAKASDIAL
jgi:hypothetical protein